MHGATRDTDNTALGLCRCGRDVRHPWVRAEYHYSFWGTIALGYFYTAAPKRIDFVCPTCGHVFRSITDTQTLRSFRYREPRPDERERAGG